MTFFTAYLIGVVLALVFGLFIYREVKKIGSSRYMSDDTLKGAVLASIFSWASVIVYIGIVSVGVVKSILDAMSNNAGMKNAFSKLPKDGDSLFGPKHNAIELEQMPSSDDKSVQMFIDLYNELYRIGTRCGACNFTSKHNNYDNPAIHIKCTYFDSESDRTIRLDEYIRLVKQDSYHRTVTIADIAKYNDVHIESIRFSFDADQTYVEQEQVLGFLRALYNMGWTKNNQYEGVYKSQFILTNSNDNKFATTIKKTVDYLKQIR